MSLTFKELLDIIGEGLEDDVAKLRADISMLDAQIVQRTKGLQDQKNRLQKMLAVKEKQLMTQTNRQQAKPEDQAQMSAQTQTQTPGGTGEATPGVR